MSASKMLRRTAARTLSGVSAVLSVAAKANEVGARWLNPDTRPPPTAAPTAPSLRAEPADTSGAPQPPSAQQADLAEVLDDGGQVRVPESRIAQLAEGNVSTVLQTIPTLSTEELEQLIDYEQSHRNRKTVLAAIERSLAPRNVETVYSTETEPT